MKPALIIGVIAAVCAGAALVAINARDQAQEPPTDTADAVATLAVVAAGAIWLGLRWGDTTNAGVRLIRAVAAGVALGAVATGLASVVFDPWAN